MINPAHLAFDIDGVIADTMHLFLDILDEHYDVQSVAYEDITCYRLDQCLDLTEDVLEGALARVLNGDYRPELKPCLGAGPVLQRIGAATDRVLMVTARSDAGPISRWMDRLMDGQHEKVCIIATGDYEAKTDVLLSQGIDWFVEDRLETCHLLKKAGIEPIVYRQPWNRQPHDYLEVGSWQELADRIDLP